MCINLVAADRYLHLHVADSEIYFLSCIYIPGVLLHTRIKALIKRANVFIKTILMQYES
jgi:hypothetical protein